MKKNRCNDRHLASSMNLRDPNESRWRWNIQFVPLHCFKGWYPFNITEMLKVWYQQIIQTCSSKCIFCLGLHVPFSPDQTVKYQENWVNSQPPPPTHFRPANLMVPKENLPDTVSKLCTGCVIHFQPYQENLHWYTHFVSPVLCIALIGYFQGIFSLLLWKSPVDQFLA